MPNHVTHKIIFSIDDPQKILDEVCPGGKFDFGKLIPMPLDVYRGDTSSIDEKDFPNNWHSWGVAHWGTKWNCYEQSCGIKDGVAFIKFDTAWSIPYPVLAAFANKYAIPFEHRYFDEGENFWGIQKWGTDQHCSIVHRIGKRDSDDADKILLGKELKGEDWFDDFDD